MTEPIEDNSKYGNEGMGDPIKYMNTRRSLPMTMRTSAISAYPPELTITNDAEGAEELHLHPAVVYFKLMDAFGEDYFIHTVQIPEHQFIGALEFGFVEYGEEKPFRPILRTPFHTHGTVKKIHTLCSRYDDDITEVEY